MYRKRCCPLISTWHDYHMSNICQCIPLCLSIAVSMSPAMTYVSTAFICIHNNHTNLDSTLTQRAGSVCLASTNLLWFRDVFNALDVNVINLSKSSLDCHIWHPPAALNSNVSNKQRSNSSTGVPHLRIAAPKLLGFHDKTQSWWVVLPWSSHQIHIHSSCVSKV